MFDRAVQLLLVEDEPAHAELTRRAFEEAWPQAQLRYAHTLADAREVLASQRIDLILADWRLPDGEGHDLLRDRERPLILITSRGNERLAVEAMRAGALDYIVKSEETLADLPRAAARALRAWEAQRERQRIERELTASEERLRLITDHASDMIGLTDERGRFLYLSPSVERTLGLSLADYDQERIRERIHPDDLARIAADWPALLVQSNQTFRFLHQDGSTRWIELSVRATRWQASSYLVFVGRDITERRRMTAQLEQAQRFEAIGQLAGGLAHDFNNMLAVIVISLSQLEFDLPDDLRSELATAKDAAARASNLTKKLLALAHHNSLQTVPVDLSALLRNQARALRALLGERSLHLDLPDGLPAAAADAALLEQVILNLVTNAKEATSPTGTITLSTRAPRDAELLGVAPPGSLSIRVRDNGSGMTEAVQRRAFEPFFSTKPQGRGTGLGLATCYGLVKQHGGVIRIVESGPERGTTIEVLIPRSHEPALALPAGKPPAPQARPAGTETLLLAEDNHILRIAFSQSLRRAGYTVLEAIDGIEALEILAQQPAGHVRLLLTDVVMPRMGGLDLARQFRERVSGGRVLLFSGYPEGIEKEALADSFLPKPFPPEELLLRVRTLLDA